ncbi:MAG: hypothetical protein ACKO8I_10920, partial [Cyanobacteriota bacterium]
MSVAPQSTSVAADHRADLGPQPLDVLIVGGGVGGTALLFELARYTDLGRIALVERYDQLARVKSKDNNN